MVDGLTLSCSFTLAYNGIGMLSGRIYYWVQTVKQKRCQTYLWISHCCSRQSHITVTFQKNGKQCCESSMHAWKYPLDMYASINKWHYSCLYSVLIFPQRFLSETFTVNFLLLSLATSFCSKITKWGPKLGSGGRELVPSCQRPCEDYTNDQTRQVCMPFFFFYNVASSLILSISV